MSHYKNITILDNDADSCHLFINAVNDINSSAVVSCYNSVEDFISEPTVTSEIVFLEINLNKMNGFKAVETFKTTRHLKDIPLVIFSNSRDNSDISELYILGANRYFIKPVDYAGFERILRLIIMKDIDMFDTNDFGNFVISAETL